MIVHIFNSSVVSGPETLAMPALRRLGEEVQIIFLTETRLAAESEGPVKYAESLGYVVHRVPVRGRWDRKAFGELRELLDRLAPSIAHAHDVKASLYLHKASRAKPGFTPKTVSTHHGAAARKGKIRLYEEFYVRFLLPKFDGVLCVCRSDRESLIRRGVPESRLSIHYNGVDRTLVPAEDRARIRGEIRGRWQALQPALPIGEDAVYIGVVARLSPEKRHDRMLGCMSWLKANRPDLKPVLVAFGIGGEEKALKELTNALDVADRVFWMGYSKTIGQEVAGFDLLLCLSYGEGIPINLIEAGWAGTPVFSTAVGGIPDLLGGPEYGYQVPNHWTDAAIARRMGETLSEPRALEQVGRNFQKRILEGFSEKSWLDQLRTAYARLR